MSFSHRHGKSVATLAAALWVLTTGTASADGGNLPKLIKTTVPVRVDSSPAHDDTVCLARSAKKAALVRAVTLPEHPLAPLADDAAELGMLLDPQALPKPDSQVQQTAGGTPRSNHFVEGDSDGVIDTTDKLPAARSAAVPQRNRVQRGEVQQNPLVVDAPPKLRRFQVQDLSFATPTIVSQRWTDRPQVVPGRPLPPQPVADLDAALDVLSVESSPAPAILGTAQNSGFGRLAIDQIGEHLEPSASAEHTMAYPSLGRFPTDLVLPPGQPLGLQTPSMASPFREQLGAIDTGNLIEDRSLLFEDTGLLLEDSGLLYEDAALPSPSPSAASELDAIARSLQVLGRGVARPADSAALELASNDNGDRVALEVDELLAASSEQPQDSGSDPEASSAKPSFTEKFVGWSKKLTFGRTSPENKAVSTRLPSELPASRTVTPSRKRSGGILNQWFNKSR